VLSKSTAADFATAWITPPASPPTGAAGGSLSGTFPNPVLAAGAAATNLGAPTGDLTGSYPSPTVSRVNGAALGATTPLARGDILVANATPQLVRLAKGATGQVLQTNATDTVWGAPPASAPTGAAGGSLSGTFPNPSLAATTVVSNQMAIGSTTRALLYAAFAGGFYNLTSNVWITVGSANITVRGGWVLAGVTLGGVIATPAAPAVGYCWFRVWFQQNSMLITQVRFDPLSSTGAASMRVAAPSILGWAQPAAGTYTVVFDVNQQGGFFIAADAGAAGYLWAMEFS